MLAHIESPKENKSREISNPVNQKKSNSGQGLGFGDNRPEAKQATQIQTIVDNCAAQQQHPIQPKANLVHDQRTNNTGSPDNFKFGIVNLSDHSLDDIKMHRNSDKHSQLYTHAYTQGSAVHIAIGVKDSKKVTQSNTIQRVGIVTEETKNRLTVTPLNGDAFELSFEKGETGIDLHNYLLSMGFVDKKRLLKNPDNSEVFLKRIDLLENGKTYPIEDTRKDYVIVAEDEFPQVITLLKEVFFPSQPVFEESYSEWAKSIEHHTAWNDLYGIIKKLAKNQNKDKIKSIEQCLKEAILGFEESKLWEFFRLLAEIGIHVPQKGINVYWGGKKGEEKACKRAEELGGVILPDTGPRHVLEALSSFIWGKGGSQIADLSFGTLSRIFAAFTKGKVEVYLENEISWNNFFIAHELPVLTELAKKGVVTGIEVYVYEGGEQEKWNLKVSNFKELDRLKITSITRHKPVDKSEGGGTGVELVKVNISISKIRTIARKWKENAKQKALSQQRIGGESALGSSPS